MSSPVSITAARAEDREAIVALLRAQLLEHEIDTPEHALREVVNAVVDDPRHGFILLAQQDERTAGIAYVAAHLSAEHGGMIGWLEELYVRPESRGSGVGSALLKEVASRAQQLGWNALELEVVAGHERVVPLYERCGFALLPRTRFTRMLTALSSASDG
ncbi:MAG TPA: GNAT family N-acetyltransferase [Chthoniobacterales bacterium]